MTLNDLIPFFIAAGAYVFALVIYNLRKPKAE
jgi:hypothetical protein